MDADSVAPGVAIVGARDDNLWTYLLFSNLERFGTTEIWPVSRTRPTVRGRKTHADLDDLPRRPEVAVLAVAATGAVPAVRQAVALGVPHIVLISDGFAERGTPEGRRLQDELVESVSGTGSRLYGPNGVGFADFRNGLLPLGAPIPPELTHGPVSVVSQSGSLCTSIMGGLAEDGVGVDWCVSVGNGATFDVLDAFEASLDRPDTTVICSYVESFGGVGGRARLEAILARANERGVRVVVAKSGSSAVGVAIARSHTAAVAGPDRLVDEVLQRHGVLRARSMEELSRAASICAYLASRERAAAAPGSAGGPGGLAIIETSGGAAALLADIVSQEGVGLATFGEATRQALAAVAPDAAYVSNPIDLTASPKPYDEVTEAFRRVYADDAVGCVLIPYALTFPVNDDERATHKRSLDRYADLGASTGTPIIVSTLSEFAWTDWAHDFRRRHPEALLVRGVVSTVRVLSRLYPQQPVEAPAPAVPVGDAADGHTAREVLQGVGAPVPPAVFVPRDEAGALADAVRGLRFPVAVKVVAEGLLHKAQVGGVRIGCADPEEVAVAGREILAAAHGYGLDARVRGVLVEEMVSGPELFVALDHDPWFGRFLVLGSGGGQAEHRGDAQILALPADVESIRAALPPGLVPVPHVNAVVRLVHRLGSEFLDGSLSGWSMVELNPVMIDPSGPQIVDIVLQGGARVGAGVSA
jgi:acetate---CoA ligase (ADP-forming)